MAATDPTTASTCICTTREARGRRPTRRRRPTQDRLPRTARGRSSLRRRGRRGPTWRRRRASPWGRRRPYSRTHRSPSRSSRADRARRRGHPGPAGLGLHVGGLEPVAALGAGELWVDGVAAGLVADLDRRALLAGHPLVAPSQQGDQDRPEVEALLGEPVLEAVGTLGVEPLLEHAIVDEGLEAFGQERAGGAGAHEEVLEAAHAHERLLEDEHRPAVADDRQGLGDRAVLLIDLTPSHAVTLVLLRSEIELIKFKI